MLSWNTSDADGVEEWSPVLRSDRAEEWEDDADFEEDAELELASAEEDDDDDDEEWESFEEEFDDDEPPHPRHRPRSDWE